MTDTRISYRREGPAGTVKTSVMIFGDDSVGIYQTWKPSDGDPHIRENFGERRYIYLTRQEVQGILNKLENK